MPAVFSFHCNVTFGPAWLSLVLPCRLMRWPGCLNGVRGPGKIGKSSLRLSFLRLATVTLFVAVSSGGIAGQTVALSKEQSKAPQVVVEMFTSQGCGYCPPADEFLADLARAGEVVALAYHVDYWDYLGWRDTMATAGNTARQQEYSQAFGNRSVYTPQAVVNGRLQMNGAKRHRLEEAIANAGDARDGTSVDLSVSYEADVMVIEAGAADGPARKAQLMVVYFEPATQVKIEHGKNAGREMTYWNAVSSFHSAGMWRGEKMRIELPANETVSKGAGGCAVLLQEFDENDLPGAILGAAIITRPEE